MAVSRVPAVSPPLMTRKSPLAGAPLAGLGALLLLVVVTTWLSSLSDPPSAKVLSPTAGAGLWTWDGTGYSLRPLSLGPRGTAADMAADPGRGVILWEHGCSSIVTGFTGGCQSLLNATWTWDGRAWTRRHPASSPVESGPGAMFYEGRLGAVLYVNGIGLAWAWSGSDWRAVAEHGAPKVIPPSAPSRNPPSMFAAGYDEGRAQLVYLLSDRTWTWDGSTWRVVPGGLEYSEARPDAHLVYDRAGRSLVYVGSHSTWTWDGSAWRPHPQPEFAVGSEAYDPRGSRLLFVAVPDACAAADCRAVTWLWDGVTWTPAPPARGLPAPTGPGSLPPPITADAADGTVFAFTGAG